MINSSDVFVIKGFTVVLPGTIYYLGLPRPTIMGLYSGLVDKLQNTSVDCNRGLYNRN